MRTSFEGLRGDLGQYMRRFRPASGQYSVYYPLSECALLLLVWHVNRRSLFSPLIFQNQQKPSHRDECVRALASSSHLLRSARMVKFSLGFFLTEIRSVH